jgi:hypothetical protein
MHDQRNGVRPHASPNHKQDIRDQGIVLMHVLALHPTNLIVPDLVRELTNGSDEFAEGDNAERAIRDLTGVGLIHCPGGLVMPTRAALRFIQILNGGA